MQTRRLVLVLVLVVFFVLMAVLIHGCQASATRSSLQDYNNHVSALITESDANGSAMFKELTSGEGSNAAGETKLESQLVQNLAVANSQLRSAQRLVVPSAMNAAQQSLVLVMTERRDGIKRVAANIEAALNSSTSKDGVYGISVGMAFLFASDVLYKGYVTNDLAKALHGDGIDVCPAGAAGTCGPDSVTINSGQIVSDLGWLQNTFIGERVGAQLPTNEVNKDQPGTHGESLNSVTVDGTQLSPTGINKVSAKPTPTFVLNVTNGGEFSEYEVGCVITIAGLGDTVKTAIPVIAPGQTTTCSVTLSSAPEVGTYQVKARIEKVPGETNLGNNVATYTVTFN